jgi:hypothetical protein
MLMQFGIWVTDTLANLVLQLHISLVFFLFLIFNLLLVLLNSSLICQVSESVSTQTLILHFAERSLQLLMAIWRKWLYRSIRLSNCNSCYLDLRTERWQQVVVFLRRSITQLEVGDIFRTNFSLLLLFINQRCQWTSLLGSLLTKLGIQLLSNIQKGLLQEFNLFLHSF